MLFKSFIAALAGSSLVAAHGKIAVVYGDKGGNTTAIGILGGMVPGAGDNSATELDTTVFSSTNIATDGLGETAGLGPNTQDLVGKAMALSGLQNPLPQVSRSGGTISGVFHIVTTDGAGPVAAIVDPTGTGKFSTGVPAQIIAQVPGSGGNISPAGTVRRRGLHSGGLVKRADNVNRDYPVSVAIPAGTKCTGIMAGQYNVCFLKIANSNANGPFGGVVAFQMVD
ncbi:hypothetical protein ANO11243_010200 [Dothideomycetidae sp. 11243]|nr:hypothetical protein ANO11243_010200 [fungal sp. No.11243]